MGNKLKSDISRVMKTLNIVLIALFLDCVGKVFPEVFYRIFAYPAAYLAAQFFGVQPVFIDRYEILIPLMHHPIHVIPACSAYGFFCLLTALMLSYSWRASGAWKVLWSAAVIPAAFLITIVLNAVRMVSAYQAHEIASIVFPKNFQAAVHQGIGISIFLTALLGISFLLERKCRHDRTGQ